MHRSDFTCEDIEAHADKLRESYLEILRAAVQHTGPTRYRAVAERLGLPLGTVKSRLHRARAALNALKDRTAAVENLREQAQP